MAKDPLSIFHAPVRAWFDKTLGSPTRAQALGWPPIGLGESTLLLAPTGSGKTLAAFLAAIDRLVWDRDEAGCSVLYVSPLKALAIDVERNLRAPLAGVVEAARAAGEVVRVPSVLVRTGDTPQADRARMRRRPPDILITTPESLYLVLTSQAREVLSTVRTVIVDEIHSMVATKRGAHLFLSLERLEELRRPGSPRLQRIGLSATQRPLDEVARLLGGFENGVPRPVTIVDAGAGSSLSTRVTKKGAKKRLELTIEVPRVDMARLGEIEPKDPLANPRSIWPHMHERLVELIRAHRSTMIFANSRRLAERLASALNDLAGEEIALAHHGSVAREKRAVIEDRLKRGDLPAIVATSSLELGIDMGAVDLVVQIEAPPSVASGLQRVGRGGHSVGDTSRGILFPKHRADLLACAAATRAMLDGQVEETFYPRNPLDVLAQQIVAIAAGAPIDVEELYALVRRAAPFAELPRGAFEGVLDMLSGRYPSDRFAELRPRITWDRARGRISARQGAQHLAIVNGGTIPDRGLYGVFLGGGAGDDGATEGKGSRRVGELDEEMVFELRIGEVFLLGASSWRAEEITRDRVIVSPAAGVPGKMPFWHGDRPGRPRAFGVAIGKLTHALAHKTPEAARALLRKDHGLDDNAITNLLTYVREQMIATGEVPSDQTIVIERFADELGDFRVCVLTPFGARVHAPWATAVATRLRELHAGEVETVWSDDGMVFRLPQSDQPPAWDCFFPKSSEVERIATNELGHTSLFAGRFRECAGRALLLPRRQPGKRTPLWAQRKRGADLLQVASAHPSFPILLETYRECLRDVFDVPGLVDVLARVESRQMNVVTVQRATPSPFAASLLFSFVANFIYDGDAPMAERRVQALSIDHAQLRELLGEAELRQLLDPEAIAEYEQTLARLVYRVKHADSVHDLLLFLGDLSDADVRARAEPENLAPEWIAELEKDRRVVRVQMHGETRIVAMEDIGRYRDALGIKPPRGIPAAYLEKVADPMGDLVGRFARTRGPFVADDVAAHFGLPASAFEDVLARLVRTGRIVEGAFLQAPRPGAPPELCDAEVLRVLRRKSLARLRREVEPVDQAAYGRFLLAWHHIGRPRRGPDALLEVVAQLQGCPLPASVLMDEILPARVEGFRPWDLDMLCATGQIVWAGIEPLGANDGRVALYLAEHEALLAPKVEPLAGEVHARIRALLERRGAVFFAEIARDVGGFPAALLEALWDLVWAGEVTNDTLEPLRTRARVAKPSRPSRPSRSAISRRETARGRSWGASAPGSEGRWSLRRSRWAGDTSDTQRRTALARTLLERYGVLTREVAAAEGIAGGFSAVYEILKVMEESGRARRGYFVAGRGATQFALPGADDRLRASRDVEAGAPTNLVILAATDPANPYGAALAWPDREGEARPQRAAGAKVILRDGALLAYLGKREEKLLAYLSADEPEATAAAVDLARALAKLVDTGKSRTLILTTIDGAPAQEHRACEALLAAGFTRKSDSGLYRRRVMEASPRPSTMTTT